MKLNYSILLRSVVLLFILGINVLWSYAQTYNSINSINYSNSWTCDISGTPLCNDPAFHNPAYNFYIDNDCANYVSQCLIAGGLNLNSGPGLDSWGCIPFCDNLHTNLVSYQNATYQTRNSGYPSSQFSDGDIVMFGDGADPWRHSVINVSSGTPALNSHTNHRYHRSVSFYYPQSNFLTGYFYHLGSLSGGPQNDNCPGTQIISNGACKSGTVSGASSSYGANQCSGCNCASPDDYDVYYYFTAQATSHTVTLSNYASNFDGVIELRTACASGSGNFISCYDPSGAPTTVSHTWNNLTIGQTYYIRVFEYNYSGTPPSSPTFNICVTHTNPCTTPTNPTSFTPSSTSSSNPTIINSTSTTLSWSGGTGSCYSLVVLDLTTSTPVVNFACICGNSYSINGLQDGHLYEYSMVSYPSGSNCTGNCYSSATSNRYFKVELCSPSSSPSSASSSPTSICSGNSSTLNVFGGALGTGASWKWYSSGCGSNYVGSGSSISVNPSSTTTYYVRAEGDCGTTSCASVQVSVTPLPQTPTINNGQTPTIDLCPTEDATLIATNVCNGCSTQWSTGSTNSSIMVSNAGTYYVTVSNNCGTAQSSSIQVNTINTPVNPVVTTTPNPATICNGESVTITANSNGCSGCVYSWSPLTNLNPISGSPVTASPISTTTYTVTAQNQCGTASGTATVTVNSPPVAPVISPSNPPAGCNPVLLTASSCSGCTYEWSTPNGSQNTGTSNQISASVSGNYSVVATQNGCLGSLSNSVSVTITGGPTVSLSGLQSSYCADAQSVTLTGTPSGGSFSGSGISGSQFNPSTAGVGTHIITYSYDDGNGCIGQDQQSVIVQALPSPTISGNPSFCQGTNTTLDAGSGYTSYLWSPGGTTSQTVVANNAQTYTVQVTDNNGCLGSSSVSVIEDTNPTPSISGSLSFCPGSSTTLDAGNGYTSYLWSAGNQTTPSISINTAGAYTVTVTDNNGCQGSATVNVSQSSTLSPSLTVNPGNTFCPGETVTINAGAYDSYQWSPSGETTPSIQVMSGGTYTVNVTQGNCSGSGSITVSQYSSPTAYAGQDVTIVPPSSSVQLSGSASGGSGSNYSYSWSPTTGLDNSNVANPVASPSQTTTYTLTVTDGNGCQHTDNVVVEVVPPPSAPQAWFNPQPHCGTAPLTVYFQDQSTNNPTSWNWFFNGGTPNSSTDQHPQGIVYNTPGQYTVTLTTTNSGGSSTVTYNYVCVVASTSECTSCEDMIIGVNEIEPTEIIIIPNPTSGEFSILSNGNTIKAANIRVINTLGQVVYTEKIGDVIGNFRKDILLPQVSTGSYSVELYNDEIRIVEKLLIAD